MLEHSWNEIFTFERDSLRFQEASHGARLRLGYSPEELRELTPLDIKPKFTRREFEELLQPLVDGAVEVVEFETWHQSKDAVRYPVEVRVTLSDEEVPVFVAIVQDLSDRHSYRDEQYRFEGMFEFSPVPMRLVDTRPVMDWISQMKAQDVSDLDAYAEEHFDEAVAVASRVVVTAGNQALVELFGSGDQKLVGRLGNLPSVIGADPKAALAVFSGLAAGSPRFDLKALIKRPDGEVRHVQLSLVAPTVAGKPDYSNVMVAYQDVTETEEALLRAEELSELKSRLLMSVAHELRTPLTSVVGFSALLEDDSSELDDGEVSEIVSLISSTSRQMGGIVEDLLATARVDIGELPVTPVVIDLVDQVSASLRTVDVRERTVVVSGESVLVLADPGRVRQIMRNLITNAVRYGEGVIRVETALDSAGEVGAIRVRDQGPGVSPDYETRIFDAYWRGDESIPTSLGMGLPISLDFAMRMGGELSYRREGDETVFELILPLAPGGKPGGELTGPAAAGGLAGE